MVELTNSHDNRNQSEPFRALIDTIREEAIEEAEKKSADIIAEAQRRAVEILETASREAENATAEARLATARFEAAGNDALSRASRDTLLSLQQAIGRLLGSIIQREIREELSGDALLPLLEKVLSRWNPEAPGAGIEVLLGIEQARHLEDTCLQKLQKALRTGAVLRPVDDLDAGFRVGEKGGHVHYDFTADFLAGWMTRYLQPRLAGLLGDAAGELAGIQEQSLTDKRESPDPGTE